MQLDYDVETDLRGDSGAGRPTRSPCGRCPPHDGTPCPAGHQDHARGLVRRRRHLAEGHADQERRRLVARVVPTPAKRRLRVGPGERPDGRRLQHRAGDHPGLRPAMRPFLDGPREGDLPGPVPCLPTARTGRILSPPRSCEGERCRCSSRWASRLRSSWSTARSSDRPSATRRPTRPRRSSCRCPRSSGARHPRRGRAGARPDDESYAGAPPAVALGRPDHRAAAGSAPRGAGAGDARRAAPSAVAGQSISDLIEVVTGVDAIRHRFQQVQQAADHEMRTFITAPFVAVRPGRTPPSRPPSSAASASGRWSSRRRSSEPGATAEAIDSLRRGLELRVVDQLPIKLVLADADLALVPLEVAPGGEPGRRAHPAQRPARRPRGAVRERSGARPTRSTCRASRSARGRPRATAGRARPRWTGGSSA